MRSNGKYWKGYLAMCWLTSIHILFWLLHAIPSLFDTFYYIILIWQLFVLRQFNNSMNSNESKAKKEKIHRNHRKIHSFGNGTFPFCRHLQFLTPNRAYLTPLGSRLEDRPLFFSPKLCSAQLFFNVIMAWLYLVFFSYSPTDVL